MNGSKVLLDEIAISAFASTEYMMSALRCLESRHSNGCLLGEFGSPIDTSFDKGVIYDKNYHSINIERAVVRFTDLEIKIQDGKVMIYAVPNYIFNDWFTEESFKNMVTVFHPRYILKQHNIGKYITNILTWDLDVVIDMNYMDEIGDFTDYQSMLTEVIDSGMTKHIEEIDIGTMILGKNTYDEIKKVTDSKSQTDEFNIAIINDYTDMIENQLKNKG